MFYFLIIDTVESSGGISFCFHTLLSCDTLPPFLAVVVVFHISILSFNMDIVRKLLES